MTLPHAQIATGLPRKGELLPDFELLAADGTATRLSDVRGRYSMILLVPGGAHVADLLSYVQQLGARTDAFHSEQAKFVVIVPGEAADAAHFANSAALAGRVFAGPQGRAHERIGSAPAIFVTDRYGEIFVAFYGNTAKLPSADELLEWVEFVNMQCEECFPPEWPA